MKRNLLLAIATLLLAGSFATAQDWKEALKKAATTAADKATDGKLTQYALAGTWNYTAPGVKFEGNDLLSQLGGSSTRAIRWPASNPAPVRSHSPKTANSPP